MLSRPEDFVPHRVALLGAALAIAGILLSGPLAAGLVTLVLAAATSGRRMFEGVP